MIGPKKGKKFNTLCLSNECKPLEGNKKGKVVYIPTDRKEIESKGRNVGTESELHSSLADKIISYLFANADKVFSQRELSEVFQRSEQQIRQTCLNLVKVGKVDRLKDDHASSREPRFFFGISKDLASKISKGIEAVKKVE
jgi:uncharacterized protein (DUF2225 family)